MKKHLTKLLALLLALLILCGCAAVPAETTGSQETTAPADDSTTAPETTGPVDDGYEEKHKLSNPNANVTTQKIYDYICELSGKGVMAAQQESTWMGSDNYEFEYIFDKTGKYPAMRGLDYMNDDFKGVNERAIKWWNQGGLVTICWHCGSDFSGSWSECMNTTVPDWKATLTEGTPENEAFLAGMDKAAKALLELQDAGVTVIWRPFHEFDGKWFWWGKAGAKAFTQLWQMMYDRYTNYWGLNNLIWVLGYSGGGKTYPLWYPGDEYCDILGADSYDGGAQNGAYVKLTKIGVEGKPYCFHECGTNPTAEELKTTPWTWFMTWHTEHITDQNDPAALNELYNDDYVITLDELPSFTD